jgi:Cdc6-like AAA superfamily ATPase
VERGHLLIIGAPRTGTTLLATMISRHTEIGVLNEDKGWAMRKLLGKSIVGNKRCIPNQIEIKKRSRLYVRLWKKIGLAKEYQSSRFCIEDYLTLPHIKVIGIIREGNDGISSGMRRGKKGFRGASYRWCRAIEIIHELKTRFPELVLVVSFEDLVMRPKENMQRIAEFLNVEYQDRMLEGPAYNPWYPESGMNEEKVNRSEKDKIDFKLEEKFPSIQAQYRELLRHCQPSTITQL